MQEGKLRLGAACAVLLVAGAISGCGGDDPPEPSIPPDEAALLIETLDEVQENVDVGSCLVAEDKTQELQAQIERLSTSVNDDVVDALQRGTLSLGELVADPAECESPQQDTTTEETTTEETTTDETTTEETTTTDPTTTTTPTTPTTPPDPSLEPNGGGGVSPGDGL